MLKTSKYYSLLLLCYVLIDLSLLVYMNKIIIIGPFLTTFANLVIPIWFFIGNLIAEIYGHKTSRRSLWVIIILQFIIIQLCWFSQEFITTLIDKINVATIIPHEIHRTTAAQLIALCLSGTINTYIINNFKTLLNGKYFVLRGLGASAIGEFIFIISYNLIAFIHIIPNDLLIKIIISSYMINLITNIIIVAIFNIVTSIIATIKSQKLYQNVEIESVFDILDKTKNLVVKQH